LRFKLFIQILLYIWVYRLPSNMAQTSPLIQVLQDQIGSRIFIRRCADFLASANINILYLSKNEIEVV